MALVSLRCEHPWDTVLLSKYTLSRYSADSQVTQQTEARQYWSVFQNQHLIYKSEDEAAEGVIL